MEAEKNNKDLLIFFSGMGWDGYSDKYYNEILSTEEFLKELFKEKYPHVSIVFGTHNLHMFKEYLIQYNNNKKKIFDVWESEKEINEKLDVVENKIYEAVGERFNINSPKQLGEILFEKLELPEDQEKGMEKDIQDLVNEYNKKIEAKLKEKEQELLTV
mgnify:CR=1 FL=1